MPGDYGFDPLNLGSNPQALDWYRNAELQNGRWAMLGVAGMLGTSIFHKAGADIPEWFTAGKVSLEQSGIPYPTLVIIQFFAFNFVELKRYQDMKKPGSQAEKDSFLGFEQGFKGTGMSVSFFY